jgi:hypothetical protein
MKNAGRRILAVMVGALVICGSPAASQTTDRVPLVGVADIDTAAAPAWFDGDNLRSLIESSVVRSQKFIIPERSDTALTIRDQNLAAKGISSTEVRDPLNYVNFLVNARVAEFSGWPDSENTPGIVGALFQIATGAGSTPKRNVTLTLDVRISDIRSGKVISSGLISANTVIPPQKRTGDTNPNTTSLYLPINLKNIREFNSLINDIASRVTAKLVLGIYPITVIASDQKTVTFNYGSEYVAIGEEYEIYGKGEDLVDPYTKKVIATQDIPYGRAKISKVMDAVSVGEYFPLKPKIAISPNGALARKVEKLKK